LLAVTTPFPKSGADTIVGIGSRPGDLYLPR
jgi:hypothetical protein